jgi:hypothetical protein
MMTITENRCEVKGFGTVMKKSLKVEGSEVKIFGEMRELSWTDSYTVCMWVTVHCLAVVVV